MKGGNKINALVSQEEVLQIYWKLETFLDNGEKQRSPVLNLKNNILEIQLSSR